MLPLQAVFSSYSTITREAVSTDCEPWGRGTTWTSRWVSNWATGRAGKTGPPPCNRAQHQEGLRLLGLNTGLPSFFTLLAVHNSLGTSVSGPKCGSNRVLGLSKEMPIFLIELYNI